MARREYEKAVGQPKQGDWSLSRSRFSPAVYQMAELDPRQDEPCENPRQSRLNNDLAFLGKGAGVSVN